MATHARVPAWRIPWTEVPGGCSPEGRTELDTTEGLSMLTLPPEAGAGAEAHR